MKLLAAYGQQHIAFGMGKIFCRFCGTCHMHHMLCLCFWTQQADIPAICHFTGLPDVFADLYCIGMGSIHNQLGLLEKIRHFLRRHPSGMHCDARHRRENFLSVFRRHANHGFSAGLRQPGTQVTSFTGSCKNDKLHLFS